MLQIEYDLKQLARKKRQENFDLMGGQEMFAVKFIKEEEKTKQKDSKNIKIKFDNDLQRYIDEGGNIIDGVPVIDLSQGQGASFGTYNEASDIIGQDLQIKEIGKTAVSVEKTIENLKNQLKALENSKKELHSRLLNEMQKRNLWKIEVGDIIINRTKSYERSTIDTKRLKTEMPDIAKLYENISIINESIRIKISSKNDNS